jgi:hypothetical protein
MLQTLANMTTPAVVSFTRTAQISWQYPIERIRIASSAEGLNSPYCSKDSTVRDTSVTYLLRARRARVIDGEPVPTYWLEGAQPVMAPFQQTPLY